MEAKNLLTDTPVLLGDRVRLAIMAMLAAASKPVEFMELLDSLDLTKGNLSTHMRKLEEGGLVIVVKEFVGKKPRTTYTCTETGRKEILEYLKRLEEMLKSAKGG